MCALRVEGLVAIAIGLIAAMLAFTAAVLLIGGTGPHTAHVVAVCQKMGFKVDSWPYSKEEQEALMRRCNMVW